MGVRKIRAALGLVGSRSKSVKSLFGEVGVHVVRALILALHTRDFFALRTDDHAALEDLGTHALQTASFARKLASADRRNFRECQTAYVAGLLHDIGKFMLAAHPCFPLQNRHANEANHAALGAYFLGLWGLPEPIVSAAELHHALDRTTARSSFPIVYVHAAQCLGLPGRADELDWDFVSRVGKADRVPVWKELLLSNN